MKQSLVPEMNRKPMAGPTGGSAPAAHRLRMTTALAVCAALVLVAAPAGGASGPTGVVSLDAAVSDGVLSVTGSADFVDVPRLVGEDPSGDAIPSDLGFDLTGALVSRPDPFANSLGFDLRIEDPVPAIFTAPQTTYEWTVRVEWEDDAARNCIMQALRAGFGFGQPFQPAVDPEFKVSCSGSGILRDWVVVGGEMDADEGLVSWEVPMSVLSPSGSVRRIREVGFGGAPVRVYTDAFVQSNRDSMSISTEYPVPSPSILIGLAPSGTPVDEVALTVEASVDPAGTFSAGVPIDDLDPGEYIVVARACYGGGNCGLGNTDVVIE